MKFLFDRAGAALDRKADRATADSTSEEAPSNPPTSGNHDANSRPAEQELRSAMQQLEQYRGPHPVPLDPQDTALLGRLERLHAALESFEGRPVDLGTAVSSLIEVDQSADHVHSKVTGADIDTPEPGSTTHIRQRFGTVGEGAEITGYRRGPAR
jgi:hypothetical protein